MLSPVWTSQSHMRIQQHPPADVFSILRQRSKCMTYYSLLNIFFFFLSVFEDVQVTLMSLSVELELTSLH